ncbi:hypothetical protein LCGC14_2468080 [marine sediment metagenome]|uniref:Fibronectin type-III domain-containing protein n=1 Tax=marine sediment metagenome TaxID=412755 RepID=A0A0F9BB60_9ZZZZ
MPTVTLRPNGIGDKTELSNDGCPNNWQCVDEEVADDDTSFNKNTFNATLEDVYTLDDLPGGVATITNVQVYIRARKTAAATCGAATYIRTGGVEYSGGIYYFPNTSWFNRGASWALHPGTGVAWTPAQVDALQAGVLISNSNFLGNQGRCTHVYVVVTYTTGIAPQGTTDPATSVVADSATLNGTLSADGGEACDCGFEWGETDAYGNTTPTESKTTSQTFSQAISGLDPGTLYHFRAIMTNSLGTTYGADQTFTTIELSTVTTDPATFVTGIAGILNATLDDDGGEACDVVFEWGLTTAYGNTTATQSKVTGEAFAQVISGLSGLTLYHFRAVSTNVAGTTNGADQTFTTEVAMPSGTTDPATAVGMAVATLNGTLDDDGGEACDCSFQWGLTTSYGNNTPTESKVTGETFSQALSGLTPGTLYHFRASFYNSTGTSYGADRTFTTTSIAAQIGRSYALGREEL